MAIHEQKRILFMGTPDFAQASLAKLIDEKFNVVAVFSQPDKPKGRGMELQPTPVKETAAAHGIPVYQPEKLNTSEQIDLVKTIAPDLIIVVAYGKKIPDEILAVPCYGAINVHGSLLPKYRGASPIQSAVLSGDRITGVTTMYLASEMDTGDVIYTATTEIGEFETSGSLFDRLMAMGADLLTETVDDIFAGTAPRIPQDHSAATYTNKLDKAMSPIQWNRSPREIIKQIYGLQPWPVATAEIDGTVYKIFSAEYCDAKTNQLPGTVVSADSGVIDIACADGNVVRITELQAPGKKRMKTVDFLRGHKINTK